MDYLLDTHAFLWYIEGNANISAKAIQIMENRNIVKKLSIASLWEIVIKLNKDKLSLTKPFEILPLYIEKNNFTLLPVHYKHLFELKDMPYHHKDPFDRLLIAQAITEDLR